MENPVLSKRKMAAKEEALAFLGKIDGDPTKKDAMRICKLDSALCDGHDPSNKKSSNCMDNPYCISLLGLEKFEKLLKDDAKKAKENRKSSLPRDIATQPCGLLNSGNFCYVNSFLQVFFNDPVFRQMVYDFRPSKDFDRPEAAKMDVEAVMISIQKVFFHLEYTPYEENSTFNFTELLRLQNAQQDAQEFTIMLFNALCHHLTSHPNGPAFVDRLKGRYYGQTRTRTWCKCGGRDSQEIQPFLSLQIPIDGNKTLAKAMEHLFATETLHECGCDACGQTDQVCRQTEIHQLPDVLIVQILRYTTDMATGRQRKLRTPMAYPRTIEASTLGPWANDVYELFAVMIHEGEATHCGHYYDLIKHPYGEKWFKYNDQVVEESKPPGFEDRPSSRPTTDMKACYGLLYRKKERIDVCVPPPPEITEPWRIEFNEGFEKERKWALETRKGREGEVCQRFNDVSDVFESLEAPLSSRPKDLVFFSLDLLVNVLEAETTYAKKILEKTAEEGEEGAKRMKNDQGEPVIGGPGRKRACDEIGPMVEPTPMKLCPHGLVSVESVIFGDVKLVSFDGCENLLSRYDFTLKTSSGRGKSLLTGKDICLDCLKKMREEAKFMKDVEVAVQMAQKALKDKSRDPASVKYQKRDNYLFVSKKSLVELKKTGEEVWLQKKGKEEDRAIIFTPNSSRVEMAPNGGPNPLKRKFPSSTSSIQDEEDEESVVGSVVAHLVDKVAGLDSGIYGDGQVADTKKHNDVSVACPSTPPKASYIVFNEYLLCSHGGRNVSEPRIAVSDTEWEDLTEPFPNTLRFWCYEENCPECEEKEEEAKADQEERATQKRQLARHFGDFTRRMEKRVCEDSDLGDRFPFGLCSRFVCSLRDSFKRSSVAFDLPKICQECLLCDHGKPFKAIGRPPLSSEDPSIVPILQREWDQLVDQWPPERNAELIPVQILPGGAIDDFCESCHFSFCESHRIKNLLYDNQTIYIQLDEGSGDGKETKRVSTRRTVVQKKLYRVRMSSGEKVIEIKLKLYTKIHQTPKDQLLFHKGELLADEMTLFDAGIEPNNSESPLRLVVQSFDNAQADEKEDVEGGGFSGTALTY